MATIAFLLLAHKEPERVIAQARALTAHGDSVTVHFDRRAPDQAFAQIRAGLKDNARVAFAPRIRCGWGTWSLVGA
ncbi:MAG: glycosyl transferase, partial [Pseudomonadota bacterium]